MMIKYKDDYSRHYDNLASAWRVAQRQAEDLDKVQVKVEGGFVKARHFGNEAKGNGIVRGDKKRKWGMYGKCE